MADSPESRVTNVEGDPGIGPPDWSAITREILCPLCDYNLRGLVEPRCPECGHRFEWGELLDRHRWEHPWLFEHDARRRSFWRTLWSSLWPGRFWDSVLPTHPPRVGRLLRYWIYVSLIYALPAMALYAIPMGQYYYDTYVRRGAAAVAVAAPGFRGFWNPPEYINPWDVWVWASRYFAAHVWLAGHIALAGLAWPWLTLLTLAIFRKTIRQARIRWVHLLRCVIYSADILPILLPLVLLGTWSCHNNTTNIRGGWGTWAHRILFLDWTAFLICLAAAGIMAIRLAIAYARYLRFPHAAATGIAVQLIVVLAMLAMSAWSFVF